MPLSNLLTPGATLNSGALRFSNFAYTHTGDRAAAADVKVTPFTDAGPAIRGSC